LKEKFENLCPTKPTGKSDLPGIDMFWSIVIANTILSILAANYPVDKLSCYDSDDGKSLLTFETMGQATSFAPEAQH